MVKWWPLIRVSNWIAQALECIGEALITASRHMKRCEDCGRLKFYGAPCKNL